MDNTIILAEILKQLNTISSFIQLLCYGTILIIIIYLGYWFFSRFFY